jgi:hypothetical protein
MMDGSGFPLDPREHLWAELFAMAEAERTGGDGRALRLIERYRHALDKPKARPLHTDDGA